MIHNLLTYRRGCKCLPCRSAFSVYQRESRLARAKGKFGLVRIDRARQMLLTFESTVYAAKITKVSQPTVSRILNRRVSKIRRTTERAILEFAA